VLLLSAVSFLLSSPADASGSAQAARTQADYGDAPDSRSAHYLFSGRRGHFPSLERSNGARHTNAGSLLLGYGVDTERDSRQVDRDSFDDGFFPQLEPCKPSKVIFLVDASRLSSQLRTAGHTAYLNAWFDWNRNGKWQGASRCGGQATSEWSVQNAPVSMARLGPTPVIAFSVTIVPPSDFTDLWARASLTLDQPFTSPDGRGQFTHGETEDYYVRHGIPPIPKKKRKKKKKLLLAKLKPACTPITSFIAHGQGGFIKFTPPGYIGLKVSNAVQLFNDGLLTQRVGNDIFFASRHVDPPNRIEIFGVFVKLTYPRKPRNVTYTELCFVQVTHDEIVEVFNPGPGPTPIINLRPQIQIISSDMNGPNENLYNAVASDPEGGPLSYAWSKSQAPDPECGTFTPNSPTPSNATWDLTGCPAPPVPGNITVTVTDNAGLTASCTWPNGSEFGQMNCP
jgi:hypothetical protein